MASGFDSSVSRIQPRTKKQIFRPKINTDSNAKPSNQEKIEQITPVVLKKDILGIEGKKRPKTLQEQNSGEKMDTGDKTDAGISKQPVLNKNNVSVQDNEDVTNTKISDTKYPMQPVKLYSLHKNRISDREEEKSVDKILEYEKPAFKRKASSQGVNLQTKDDSDRRSSDFNDNEPEKDTIIQREDTNSIQDRFKSLKKRLDSFIHQDPENSAKKNKAQENANTIKSVIKNYRSKIKHLTEELAALEDTYKFTRDELLTVKQDLYKKSLSLEQATRLGKEKTILSEEILKEMEIAVFERDRAFTTIAELKTVNKSNEELLEKAYISLEEKGEELEEAKVREKDLLQTIKQKDGEIHNLQLALAKRTADRDELFDRLEDLTIQLEDIDKSNNALDEIKGMIDKGEDELLK